MKIEIDRITAGPFTYKADASKVRMSEDVISGYFIINHGGHAYELANAWVQGENIIIKEAITSNGTTQRHKFWVLRGKINPFALFVIPEEPTTFNFTWTVRKGAVQNLSIEELLDEALKALT